MRLSPESGSSAELLPDVEDLRPDNHMQTPRLHETLGSEIAEDETLPKINEIAEKGTSPEIHEIAGSGESTAQSVPAE